MSNEIKTEIRNFLIENVYGGNDNGELKSDTRLISTRMMDSIVALKLVSYLEDKFKVEFEAHEVAEENLDTIDTIADFVQRKRK